MERGSVTGAAATLGVAQPAVSKTLQQAEGRLGFKLFTHQRNRLVPMTEADALSPEALGALAAIVVAFRCRCWPVSCRVGRGCAWPYWAPPWRRLCACVLARRV
ncbi:MAG: LysR family transcriptional regulator [bacterium]